MRSQTKRIGRPTTDNELDSDSVGNQGEGDKELNDVVQKISLDKISLEKRREEANKPLYLVRYE
jgi:hypothetical protein